VTYNLYRDLALITSCQAKRKLLNIVSASAENLFRY